MYRRDALLGHSFDRGFASDMKLCLEVLDQPDVYMMALAETEVGYRTHPDQFCAGEHMQPRLLQNLYDLWVEYVPKMKDRDNRWRAFANTGFYVRPRGAPLEFEDQFYAVAESLMKNPDASIPAWTYEGLRPQEGCSLGNR